MNWFDKITPDTRMVWIVAAFLFLLLLNGMKKIFGAALMKLYRFFIGSEDHVAPV